MPEPLVPHYVDLQNLPTMPLDVRKLRDSSFATKASGEEFHAAVLLWCACWHQVPAGSLPDDDQELASLAGLGRVVAEWMKIKAGAMRGWILCSDGRHYHPYIAEVVLGAWKYKNAYDYKRECDRLRKHNRQFEKSPEKQEDIPTFEQWMALESATISARNGKLSDGKSSLSDGNPELSDGIPTEIGLKEANRSEAKRSERKRIINPTSLNPHVSLALNVPDWIPAKLWEKWLKHRGKSYTEHAKELSIKKLATFRAEGEDPIAIIEQSIEAEWKGLFRVKGSGRKNQKGQKHETKRDVLDELTGRSAAGGSLGGRTYEHKA